MAGAFTRTTTISASESLATLGPKLSQLVDDATLSGFTDDEAATNAVIMRRQSSAPSSVAGDFWLDTSSLTLRYYTGATGQERWQPIGVGMAMKNSTAGTKVSGNVVSGNPAAFAYDGDATGYVVGVVGESTTVGSFGLLRMRGPATVVLSGSVTRGDFIKPHNSAGSFKVVSAGATQDGAMGWALASAASAASTSLSVLLFPYNKT